MPLDGVMPPEPFSPDPIDIAVGARVRLRRRELGMTQADLAHALGVSFQQVQKYERGVNRFSASTLVRAAEHLHTTVAALVGEAEGSAHVDETMLTLLRSVQGQLLLTSAAQLDEHQLRAVNSVTRAIVELAA